VLNQREKKNIAQLLSKVPAAQNSSPRSVQRSRHRAAIKALKARPLHNHLVVERPKIMSELYKQFAKFSKSKIQHFRKLEQQRKATDGDAIIEFVLKYLAMCTVVIYFPIVLLSPITLCNNWAVACKSEKPDLYPLSKKYTLYAEDALYRTCV
jgi:hypothetical protein